MTILPLIAALHFTGALTGGDAPRRHPIVAAETAAKRKSRLHHCPQP